MYIDTTAYGSQTITITYKPIVIRNIHDLFRFHKIFRKDRSITQKQLADELKVPAYQVSLAENRPSEISLAYWYRFTEMLGFRMEEPTFECLNERRNELHPCTVSGSLVQ